MRSRWYPVLVVCLAASARADQFDAIDGKAIREATKGKDARVVDRLTIADLGALPTVLRDARSPMLVAVTSKGNVARLLVVPELRKPAEGGGPAFPVFVMERFDTFDAADLSARIARGREIILFPGFQVDLDTGQVVPEGQGGDLGFDPKGTPTLVALKGAKLFTLDKVPAPDPTKPPQPTPGRAVVPADFAGRYRLFGNGQWSGTLDLTIDDKGEASGQFRSDAQGSSYAVTGRVAANVTNRLTFTVRFPRSHAEFEGYLWTEGKGALAGTFRLLDRAYGFFALREGGRFAPEGSEVGVAAGAKDDPKRIVLTVEGSEIRLSDKLLTGPELTDALKARPDPMATDPVVIRAARETAFADVLRALEAVRTAGLSSIDFAETPR